MAEQMGEASFVILLAHTSAPRAVTWAQCASQLFFNCKKHAFAILLFDLIRLLDKNKKKKNFHPIFGSICTH